MEKEWQIREREARCGMLVYIYGKSGPDLYGEIENFYLKNTEPFQNTGELILKLDKICGNVAAMMEWERILEDMSYMGIGREYGAGVAFGRTGRISSPDVPQAAIPDEAIPQAEGPEELPKEDVPNLPKTGDDNCPWSAIAILSAFGLVVLNPFKKRENEEIE